MDTCELSCEFDDGQAVLGRNGVFIWTLSPYSDPFGNMNCVYAPNNEADANSIYHVVVSDSDDFNAVKNISSLTQVRWRCMCHDAFSTLVLLLNRLSRAYKLTWESA